MGVSKRMTFFYSTPVLRPTTCILPISRVRSRSAEKFTPAQREIYDLVRAAQVAAIEAVQPGNDFLEPHRAAMKVLAEGLGELGLLPSSVEEALAPENQFYKRYTLHGTSHMLGIDVHDCADAPSDRYRHGKLEPGMVLTIEPGSTSS